MANGYSIKYQLQSAPEARDDGSSMVDHAVVAIYQVGDDWVPIPNREKVISVSGFELANVMAMPDDAPQHKADKIAAYKRLLYMSRDQEPQPQYGWDKDTLLSVLDCNDAARGFAQQADTFITVTLGQSYPVGFDI